jgi:hypothetical protein
MDLSTAPDSVLEALARAALLSNPFGPFVGALVLSAGAAENLPESEAKRWNHAIERAMKSLSTHQEPAPLQLPPSQS